MTPLPLTTSRRCAKQSPANHVPYSNQKTTPVEEEKTEEQKQKEEEGKWFSILTNLSTDKEYLKPNWDESVDRFDDMGLKEEVLRGIYGYGFNKPSPIQQKGILPIIQGHDTIAQVSFIKNYNQVVNDSIYRLNPEPVKQVPSPSQHCRSSTPARHTRRL